MGQTVGCAAGFAHRPTSGKLQAAPACDDLATVVANHALATYLDVAPPGLAARFAGWVVQRIALAVARNNRVRWQWEITVLA